METINSLDVLFPPFAEQALKLQEQIKPYGFYLFETFRSFDRQLEIWKKGREIQGGVWVIVDPKLVATKSKPGMSWHQYGTGLDAIPDSDETKEGIQWSWADTMKDKTGKVIPVPWKTIGKISVNLGLTWGGNFKTLVDYPHHENAFSFKISDLYPILTTEGLEAVWKKIYAKIKPQENVVPVTVAIPKEPPTPISVITAEDLDKKTDSQDTVWTLILKLITAIFSKK